MEKQTVFIKRYPSKGELPKCKGRSYRVYVITNNGIVYYDKYDGWEHDIEWFMEEIELPSEEEVKAELTHPVNLSVNVSTLLRDMYEHGIDRAYNFILNKLKGETNGI